MQTLFQLFCYLKSHANQGVGSDDKMSGWALLPQALCAAGSAVPGGAASAADSPHLGSNGRRDGGALLTTKFYSGK
jgi:hypothetical protein